MPFAAAVVRPVRLEAERTVLPNLKQVKKAGATTLQQIADSLNSRGVATARGGSWYPSNVRNVLARG
jgi:recombinase